jgi:hypothetical protein
MLAGYVAGVGDKSNGRGKVPDCTQGGLEKEGIVEKSLR